MEAFESNLNKAINSNLTEMFKTGMLAFASAISEKHAIEIDELLELWNDTTSESFQITSKPVKAKAKAKSKAKAKAKKGDDEEESDDNICQAIVAKTKTACTFKVSDKSETGKFCGRHLRQEKEDDKEEKKPKSKAKAKEKKEGKKEKKTKKKSDDDEESDKEEKDDGKKKKESPMETKTITLRLKKDAFGRFVDEQSGLIFNRDKCVIGRGGDEGALLPLTADDLKYCNKMKFNVKQEVKGSESKKESGNKKENDSEKEDGDDEDEEDGDDD